MSKILFINQYGAPGKYHNFKRTSELTKNFAQSGFDVTVYCSRTLHNSNIKIKAKSEVYQGVKFRYFKTLRYKTTFKRVLGMTQFAFKILFYLFQREKPKFVIVSIQSIFAAIPAYFISKLNRSKFIVEIRDLWPETLIEFGVVKKKSIFSIILRKIEKYIYKRANYIIPTMKNVEEYFQSTLRLKKYGKIININNGVDYETFKNLEENPVYEFETSGFNIVYTGSIGHANNLDLLINAGEILTQKKDIKDFNIHIFGEGSKKNELISMVKEKNIQNIYFHNQIRYEQIPPLLKSANLLVLIVRELKLYEYGISMNKIFDYLSSSTPIIATTKKTGDDIIGEAGWFSIEPANAKLLANKIIEVMYLNNEIILEKVKYANNYVRSNYSFRILSNKYIEIFNCEDNY